jgi:hypothetical protein
VGGSPEHTSLLLPARLFYKLDERTNRERSV